MKLFMCVMGCKRDQENGCIEWFRKNLENTSVSYKIFLGEGCHATHADEVILPVDDSYIRLPWKVQAALKWAANQEFTHIFKTDCDSRVWAERLVASTFEQYDYVGCFFDGHANPASNPQNWALGAGYCLSSAAVNKIISMKIEQTVQPTTMPPYGNVYAEDMFVGYCLPPSEWRRFHSEQYVSNFQGRVYNGTTDNLIVLGNAFDNKKIIQSDDSQTSLTIWAAETQMKREGKGDSL